MHQTKLADFEAADAEPTPNQVQPQNSPPPPPDEQDRGNEPPVFPELYERRVKKFYRLIDSAERRIRSEDCTDADLIFSKSNLEREREEVESAGDECPLSKHLNDSLKEVSIHFDMAIDRINSRLARLRVESSSSKKGKSPTESSGSEKVQKSGVHLTKFSTPKFHGEARKYPHFKQQFKLLIESHQSEELALLRLQTECFDKDSTAFLLVSGKTSLADAFSTLDFQFGRPQVIRDAVLRDIRSLPMVSRLNDAKGFRSLTTALLSAQTDLDACGLKHVLGDSALSHLMTKVPHQLREKIDNEALDDDLSSKEHLKLFVKFCERQATLAETHQLRTAAHSDTTSDKPGPSGDKQPGPQGGRKGFSPSSHLLDSPGAPGPDSRVPGRPHQDKGSAGRGRPHQDRGSAGRSDRNTSGQRTEKRCIFHPDLTNHFTSQCSRILNMSADDLKKSLQAGNTCVMCLQQHNGNCRASISCPVTGCKSPKGHCRLTHTAEDDAKIASKVVAASSDGIEEVSSYSVVDSSKTRKLDQAALGMNTIRPSHAAFIKAKNGQLQKVQVLHDGGADLSQITTAVAEASGIKPLVNLPELKLHVAGGRQATSFGKSAIYEVPLFDSHGKCVHTIRCASVDYIGSMNGGRLEEACPLFEDFDLAELLDPGKGEIDILIGCNYSQLHPRAISSNGSVTLGETKFGLVIYGSHPSFPSQGYKRSLPSSYVEQAIRLTEVSAAMAKKTLEGEGGNVTVIPRSDAPDTTTKDQPTSNSTASAEPDSISILTEADVPSFPPQTELSIDESTSDTPVVHSESCCPTSLNLSNPDKDFFDKMVYIDDQLMCYRCGKCPFEGSTKDRENQRKLELYRACITYDADEKIFTARMPWTADFRDLPNNYPAVQKRMLGLTKSMAKDPEMKDWYRREFEKIIEKGVLVEISPDEDKRWTANGGKVWYVNHFPVLNESSASTPLRPVFDATVSYKGYLLGDLWEGPPNLLPELPGLLLRFRERPVPIVLDISKAYWSVLLDKTESHLHRVLWNELDPSQPCKVYRMTRNSWGMSPSGGICQIALLKLAEMYRDKFPDVYNFVKYQMYVDDGTFSCDDFESAAKLAKDTHWVMAQGNFVVKHFIIGGKNVDISTDELSEKDLPDAVRLGSDQEKVLGIRWSPKDDRLVVCSRVNFSKKKRGARIEPDIDEKDFDRLFPEVLTQRMFLSVMASLFDPLGLATAYSIILKHELGRIFQLDLGWDGPIPDSDDSKANYSRCKAILRMLYDLDKVSFPRCLRPIATPHDTKPILVMFSDASETAYGAMCYFNWPTAEGPRQSFLVYAKAKPCPKRVPLLTIPRAELAGAVVGMRLVNAVLEHTTYEIERVVLITDSTIVLGQIAASPSKFKSWPATRLDEIRQSSSIDQWFHVDSANNVADDVSRGLPPSQMHEGSRYQIGPEFLSLPFDQWPLKTLQKAAMKLGESSDGDELLEVRHRDPRMLLDRAPNVQLVQTGPFDSARIGSILEFLFSRSIPPPDKHASWLKLRRNVARVIHFGENVGSYLVKLKTGTHPPKLADMQTGAREKWFQENDRYAPSPDEIQIAKLFWVKQAQQSLPDDVPRKMASLNPVQDAYGIWHALGRAHTEVNLAPFLIPGDSSLANCLIQHFHNKCHSGGLSTHAALSTEFWVTKGQILCNGFVRNCGRCQFLRKRLVQVEISPLKDHHGQRSQVFETCALDMCGPYLVKADHRNTRANNAKSGKVWVLAIICSASQAVHLELVEGYDTSGFLAALDNFVSVRGTPSLIIADRGSQIVSASNTMEALWSVLDETKAKNHFCDTTKWEFVPSGAHSFLGLAERVIGTFKRTMEAMAFSKNPSMTRMAFSRLLYSIATVMNDRPLAVGRRCVSKLDDDQLIRPNDLLLGRCTGNNTELIKIDDDILENVSAKHRAYLGLMKQKNAFLDNFWSKYQKIVFPTLVPRPKWFKSDANLTKGDIVIVKDTNPVRGKWTWGEVVEVFESEDNKVRKANVRYKPNTDPKTKSKVVLKSARDLCIILKADECEPESDK